MALGGYTPEEEAAFKVRKEKKAADTIKYMDLLLPTLPLTPVNLSRHIAQNSAQLSDTELKEANYLWREILTQLTSAYNYCDVPNGMQIQLNTKGKVAKEIGGHYKYLTKDMRMSDYIVEIIKWFKKNTNTIEHVGTIFQQLHFDETLADGVKFEMIKKGLVGTTKEGEYLKGEAHAYLVNNRLGEDDSRLVPVIDSSTKVVIHGPNHGPISAGVSGNVSQLSFVDQRPAETPQANTNSIIKMATKFVLKNIWFFVSGLILAGLIYYLGWN